MKTIRKFYEAFPLRIKLKKAIKLIKFSFRAGFFPGVQGDDFLGRLVENDNHFSQNGLYCFILPVAYQSVFYVFLLLALVPCLVFSLTPPSKNVNIIQKFNHIEHFYIHEIIVIIHYSFQSL